MNSFMIKAALKPFLPKLEGFLKGLELEEGEKEARIMLNVSNGELQIQIVAFGIGENGYPEVRRVIDRMTGEDLLK